LIIRLDRWLVCDGRWALLRILILGFGYDSDLAGGLVAGGSTGPGVAPFVIAGVGSCWSKGLGQGVEAGPGGGDRPGPGPGSGDFQPVPSPAVGQPGGGVQDLVAQGLGFGAGRGRYPDPDQSTSSAPGECDLRTHDRNPAP